MKDEIENPRLNRYSHYNTKQFYFTQNCRQKVVDKLGWLI